MGVNARLIGAMVAISIASAGCGDGTGIVDEPGVGAAPEAEVVTFQSAGGVELSGFSFGEGDTAVVLAHGKGGAKEDWIDVAVELAGNGVVAFPFDFRGYAGQAGKRDTNLAADVTAAVAAMRDAGATKVYVVGASTGGTAALAVAAKEDLAGVFSVSAPARFKRIDADAAANQIDEPALFVVAKDDRPYARNARALAQAAGGRLETLGGGAHGTDLLDEHGAALTQLIVAFVQSPGAEPAAPTP